jgi:hypothetical protein
MKAGFGHPRAMCVGGWGDAFHRCLSVVRHTRVDVHGFVGETVRIHIHRVVVADEPRVRVTVGKVEVILLAGEARASHLGRAGLAARLFRLRWRLRAQPCGFRERPNYRKEADGIQRG